MSIKYLFTFLITLCFLALVGCESKVRFAKAAETEVDPTKLSKITGLSKRILAAQRAGGYYALTEEEATADMINGLTESVQKSAYEQVSSVFGDYQGIEFDHLMKATDGRLVELYRFRGQFAPGAEVEVRAVINAKGKLAGFFIKPWNDNP
ncbi:MAG: hypothetical protein RIF33_16295 [Cyclobacteriaceae bacterium]